MYKEIVRSTETNQLK